MSAPSLELAIESRLENVSLVGIAVGRLAELAGLGPDECYGIQLATVEAVTNCVRHAYRGEPGHRVRIAVTVSNADIQIRILDEGLSVPEAKRVPVEPVVDPTDIASIPEGGRGVFLIHELVDRVEYGLDGSSNVLTLTKVRPPA